MKIHNQRRSKCEVMNHLIFQRRTDRYVPAGIVPVNIARAGSAIKIRVGQTKSDEGDEIHTIGESKVIARDARDGDLEEIAGRADEHHRPDRKVSVEIVVEIKAEREDSTIYGSGGKAESASKAPSIVVRSCRLTCDSHHAERQNDRRPE